MIAVTNVSGTTWTVTRGAENTTPVAHIGGFAVYQAVTTGFLTSVARTGIVPQNPIIMAPVKWLLYNETTGPQRINYTYNNGAPGPGPRSRRTATGR